jgi:hypothetical protein
LIEDNSEMIKNSVYPDAPVVAVGAIVFNAGRVLLTDAHRPLPKVSGRYRVVV